MLAQVEVSSALKLVAGRLLIPQPRMCLPCVCTVCDGAGAACMVVQAAVSCRLAETHWATRTCYPSDDALNIQVGALERGSHLQSTRELSKRTGCAGVGAFLRAVSGVSSTAVVHTAVTGDH